MSLAVHFQVLHHSEDGHSYSFIQLWLNTCLGTFSRVMQILGILQSSEYVQSGLKGTSCWISVTYGGFRVWKGLTKHLQYFKANISCVWLKWRENSHHACKAKRFILLMSSRALLSTDIQPSDPGREQSFHIEAPIIEKEKVSSSSNIH